MGHLIRILYKLEPCLHILVKEDSFPPLSSLQQAHLLIPSQLIYLLSQYIPQPQLLFVLGIAAYGLHKLRLSLAVIIR